MTDAPNPSAAKTGEQYLNLADLHTIKGWLHGLSTCPDMNDVVADGGVTVADVYRQEAREFAGRIGRIISVYTHPQPSLSVGLDRERLVKEMRDNIIIGDIGSCSVSLDGFEEAADAILALAAPAEGYVLVPVEKITGTARFLYDEGYDAASADLLDAACLPAAPTGETGE